MILFNFTDSEFNLCLFDPIRFIPTKKCKNASNTATLCFYYEIIEANKDM